MLQYKTISVPLLWMLTPSMLLLFMPNVLSEPSSPPNIFCQPLPHYIEETTTFVSDPLVISLYRCLGKTVHSVNKICVSKKVENIHLNFFDKSGHRTEVVKVNHTECHEVCKFNSSYCNADQNWDEGSCSCQCNVDTPKECEKPFRWEQVHCACRCPLKSKKERLCDKGKVFSEQACGCICKYSALNRCTKKERFLNPDTCLCSDEVVKVAAVKSSPCKNNGVISKAGLIVVILLEAILIGIIIWMKYNKHSIKMCWHRQKEDDAFDSCSIDTPTIDMNPSLSVKNIAEKKTKTKSKRQQKKCNDRPNIDIRKRPFLGIGGESKCRKYRYEMNNLVPVSSIKPISSINSKKTNEKEVKNYQNDGYDVSAQAIGSVTEI